MPIRVICDMDGVIYRGSELIPGAKDFIERLGATQTPFLFMTNNSEQSAAELVKRLEGMGLRGLGEENFFTSAMATAIFLASQKPGATVSAVGGKGLEHELRAAGLSLTHERPDYVVVGKTRAFNFEMMRRAVELIRGGAKFIGTNPDLLDPIEGGEEPAAGAILAAIERAAGKRPYIVGKPNALMMMLARRRLGARSEETLMIGDRMDTDIVAGMEAGMRTCLVLTGVSNRESVADFPYRPTFMFNHVGEIDPLALTQG
jgi:NagD protein